MFSNIFVVYVLQSDNYAIKNFITDLSDKVIALINSIIIVALLLIIYVPVLGQLVGTSPLNIWELLGAVLLAVLATFIFDALKKPRRK